MIPINLPLMVVCCFCPRFCIAYISRQINSACKHAVQKYSSQRSKAPIFAGCLDLCPIFILQKNVVVPSKIHKDTAGFIRPHASSVNHACGHPEIPVVWLKLSCMVCKLHRDSEGNSTIIQYMACLKKQYL